MFKMLRMLFEFLMIMLGSFPIQVLPIQQVL